MESSAQLLSIKTCLLVEGYNRQVSEIFTEVQCHLLSAPIEHLLKWNNGNEAHYKRLGHAYRLQRKHVRAKVSLCGQLPLSLSKWDTHAKGRKTNSTLIPKYRHTLRVAWRQTAETYKSSLPHSSNSPSNLAHVFLSPAIGSRSRVFLKGIARKMLGYVILKGAVHHRCSSPESVP